MKTFGMHRLGSPFLAVTVILISVAACGDVDRFPLRPSAWEERAPVESWEGTLVELVRTATPCDPLDESRLVVPVGTQLEFPGESVAALKSYCSTNIEAEVSIDVGARSIVYDFSSIGGPGVFAAAEFNGYVFTELAGIAPKLLRARLDREVSTVELGEEALRVEAHGLYANFEGVEFDPNDFVKIDLVFEDAEAL